MFKKILVKYLSQIAIPVFVLLFQYNSIEGANLLPPGKGALQGVIKNTKGETIPGATVTFEGIQPLLGTATDAEGFYKIIGITEGSYKIKITSIGYKSIVVEIQIIAGQTTTYDPKLEEENTQLEEVVVLGKPKTERLGLSSRASMISEMKNSPAIITGISGEQINRSVDYDAAEVAKRLPGVTLLNNFITIRGLSERYNVTFINGMIAPSTETDSRSFSFDMLPSNMLDRMVVHRSPSPDLPGDFAGGVIKIFTRNTAQERALQVSVAGQFRPGSSYTNYNTYARGGKDWLGFDDGTRAIPNGLPPKNEIPNLNYTAGAYNPPEVIEQNTSYGKLFPNNWNLKRKYVDFDKRIMLNYYDSWKIGNFKLNNLTSLSYSRTSTSYENVELRNFTDKNQTFNYNTIDVMAARIGGMQIFDFIINENNHVEFRNIFNQYGRDETALRTARNFVATGSDPFAEYRRIFYNYRSRGLYAGNLSGEHKLGENSSHNIHWGIAFARTTDNSPDQRYLELGLVEDTVANSRHYVLTAEKETTRAQSRTYLKAYENNYNAVLNYEKKLNIGLSIKGGIFIEQRERIIDGRTIYFKTPPLRVNDSLFYNITPPATDFSQLFSSDNFRNDGKGFTIYEDNTFSNSYIASNKNYAGYLALNIPLMNQRLNIYTGVRYEYNIQQVILRNILGGSTDTLDVKREKTYFLPSVNLSYNINSALIFRAAYGKTLNKPQLREIAPSAYFDFTNSILFSGNKLLDIAEIQNFDTRLEWYPSPSDFISIGAFYKKFKNIIEEYTTPGDPYNFSTPNNTSHAEAYGVEAELRKRLDFIEIPVIRDLSVIANLSYTYSSVRIDPLGNSGNNSGEGSIKKVSVNRPMLGSVPYVANLSLYYDNSKLGTKISAIYNAFGRRLRMIGFDTYPNQYEGDRHQLDIVLRQRITKNIDLNLGVQDVFNQKIWYYRDADGNRWYTPQYRNKIGIRDYTQLHYKPGSYYTLGVTFTL